MMAISKKDYREMVSERERERERPANKVNFDEGFDPSQPNPQLYYATTRR